MSVERALIAQARPHMAAAKLRDLIREEISKGCRPEVCSLPVALEPSFHQISLMRDSQLSPRAGSLG